MIKQIQTVTTQAVQQAGLFALKSIGNGFVAKA